MLGAIIGDIVGSRFEWDNNRSKEFEFFTDKCFVTDDSIMSLAVAKAILESKKDYSDIKENTIKYMQKIGRNYPDCGYGGSFYGWIFSDNPQPYNSYGKGSAMRISAVGLAAESLEETKRLSELEKISDNYLMELNKESKYVVFGPEPLFTYLVAKEREINAVRMIMVSKINNISSDKIRERLRETYA